MSAFPVQEVAPFIQVGVIDSSAGTAFTAFISQDARRRVADQLLATNNDTIDHVIELALTDGVLGPFTVGTVNVPSGSGFGGVPAIDLYVTAFPLAIQPLQFDNVWFLVALAEVAVVPTFAVTLVALGGFY